MTERHANLIGGEWVEAGDWSENRSPSDLSDVIGLYAQGSAEDVDRAVLSARAALPAWSRDPQGRGDVLDRVGDRLMAARDELGELLAREEGKTLPSARVELPHRHPGLEGGPGAGLRQYRGDEARRPGPGLGLGSGPHPP